MLPSSKKVALRSWRDDEQILVGSKVTRKENKLVELAQTLYVWDNGKNWFSNIHSFNLAMLVKQGWRLLKNTHSLFYWVYKSKYFRNKSFFRCSITKIWKLGLEKHRSSKICLRQWIKMAGVDTSFCTCKVVIYKFVFVGFYSMPNLIVIIFNLVYPVFIVGFDCKGCVLERECEDSSKWRQKTSRRCLTTKLPTKWNMCLAHD